MISASRALDPANLPAPPLGCPSPLFLASLIATLVAVMGGLTPGARAQDYDAETTDAPLGPEEDSEVDEDEEEGDEYAPNRQGPVVADEDDEDYESLPEADDPWVVQFAARTGFGFGTTFGDLENHFVMDNHIRAELFFTKRGDEHFSIGPSIELRAANFQTLEAALGVSTLLPVARGYPIELSAQIGYAIRGGQEFGDDAFIFVGTIAGGYRSFNFHHWFQTSLQAYAQVRTDLNNPRNLQFIAGLEIDFVQAFIVPALMIRMKVRGGDPDEFEDEEEDDED